MWTLFYIVGIKTVISSNFGIISSKALFFIYDDDFVICKLTDLTYVLGISFFCDILQLLSLSHWKLHPRKYCQVVKVLLAMTVNFFFLHFRLTGLLYLQVTASLFHFLEDLGVANLAHILLQQDMRSLRHILIYKKLHYLNCRHLPS